MKYFDEAGFVREHNRVYGEILRCERRKRKISQAELASGILSRTALDRVERGKARWTKAAGDTLMQRMGIFPDYFESLTTGEELDRWRLREDICLLVDSSPREAMEKTEEYRRKYKKRESIEEQFLLKVQVVLALAEGGLRDPERILEMARQAVGCTILGDWRNNLDEYWLAPGELEAILLEGAAFFVCGREEEGWELWQSVWNYPKKRKWEERMEVLILPQAAVMGMKLYIKKGQEKKAFALAKEGLELLRRNCCHCYVLPLLEGLCGPLAGQSEEREYVEQAGGFLQAFREVYDHCGYPGHRIWQGIYVDNTKEAGLVLRMLRKFHGKSRVKAVYDGPDQVVTPRHLEKIESGIHKPSYKNYSRLAKQYGKYGGWNIPLLETESAEVLELRQQVSTLMEFGNWERAEQELEKLRDRVNPNYPRVRQELLFSDAILEWKKGGSLEKVLDMMLEALHYTVPDMETGDMKWWVFQRQEMMLASDIAALYRRLGRLEEARKWIEAIIFSVGKLSQRPEVCAWGYDMVMEEYDNYLGDLGRYEEAAKMNEETILKILRFPRINGAQRVLYRIAWNAYEAMNENKMPEEKDIFRQKGRKAFQISEVFANFTYDSHLKAFLVERKEKYL